MSLYQMVTSDEVIKELEIFLKDMVIDEKIQQRTEDHLLQNFNDVLIPKKSFFSRKKTVIVQTENDVLTILNDIYIPAIDDAFKDGKELGQAFALYRREQQKKIESIKAKGYIQKLLDKVEDYKKNEYIHEGMQWSFDEKHWDKKFEKKIKQLFLDLVHRVLSLLVVHSVNDGTDVFSTYDAENMTLDDMHALFVTQDWLSKLTNGLDEKEQKTYETLKKMFADRDEKKLTGYEKDIQHLQAHVEKRKKIIETRIEESEKWFATIPDGETFNATYAGLDVDIAGYQTTYMRHQKILHTDQDEVRILIQKHNDLYEIQYMLDMHSNTIKPLFQHMFQELCKMGSSMKRMQHQDPHLRSLTSIDILKTYEEQLKKRLQQDLPNIKHSSAHMLSRERQEGYYADYILKVLTYVLQEHATLQTNVEALLYAIQEDFKKGIGPLLEEFKAVQAAFEQLRYVKTPETIRHYFDALPEQIRTANNLSQNLEVMQLESHTYQIKQVLLWLEQLQSMRDPLRDTVDELNTYYDTMHVDGENEEKIIIEGPEVEISKQIEKRLFERVILTNHIRVFGTKITSHDSVDVYYYSDHVYLFAGMYMEELSYESYLTADFSQIMLYDQEKRSTSFSSLSSYTGDICIEKVLKRIMKAKCMYPVTLMKNHADIRGENIINHINYVLSEKRFIALIKNSNCSLLFLMGKTGNITFHDFIGHEIKDIQKKLISSYLDANNQDLVTAAKQVGLDQLTIGLMLKSKNMTLVETMDLLYLYGYEGAQLYKVAEKVYRIKDAYEKYILRYKK